MFLDWDQALQWGEKAKNGGQIGKISANEASTAVVWRGEKGGAGGTWRHAFDMPLPRNPCFKKIFSRMVGALH